MICKVKNSGTTAYKSGNYVATSISNAEVLFLKDSVSYKCSVSANAIKIGDIGYIRAGFLAIATFGTQKPLVKDIVLYNKIRVNGSTKGILATFRTGAINDTNTQINTATILQSNEAKNESIALLSSHPYLVLGNYYNESNNNNTSSFYVNHNEDITEIYLE